MRGLLPEIVPDEVTRGDVLDHTTAAAGSGARSSLAPSGGPVMSIRETPLQNVYLSHVADAIWRTVPA